MHYANIPEKCSKENRWRSGEEETKLNPSKVGSLKRHQRLGGGCLSPPSGYCPSDFFCNFFLYHPWNIYINEAPMQKIGSLAFKFWMWWPPKDLYRRSNFWIFQILVESKCEIWRSYARNDHQIITGHPIDLKLVANRPGWILMNVLI